MAYLMSDMAAGSDAALQMQRNFAAAPNVQQAQQDLMQKQQLDLQQEQANVDKTRLNNMVTESGFKAAEDSKAKLVALTQSKEWKSADDAARLRMSAAVQMETGDVEGGAKTLAASEVFDGKKVAAEQKRLDLQAQVIGNAYGVIEAIPENKVNEFVSRLPKPQQDALISQVGKDIWDDMDGKQKKDVARNLMMNAKGQLAQLKFEADLKRTKELDASRERVAEIQKVWHLATKAGGGAAAKGSKEDLAATKLFLQQSQKDQVAYKDKRKTLDASVDSAQTEVDKGRLFGTLGASDTTIASRDAAIQARKVFEVDQAERDYSTASLLPEGPGKSRIIQEIKRRVAHLGTATQEEPTPAKEKPKANDTSNKPLSESDFNTKWASAKAGDKLTGPDGKTYTKK